jgi:hypothetical protein
VVLLRKLALASCLLIAAAAQATSLKDFWASRRADAPRFQSTKTALALEMCLGMDISEKIGVPAVLHGENETIITGMSGGIANQPMGGFRIVDHGASRE